MAPIAKRIPLTSSQLGIYIDSIKDSDLTVYHIPILLRLNAVDDAERLAEAVREVIRSYPGMSARIICDDEGNPYWHDCAAAEPLPVEIVEMPDAELLANPDKLVQPFELDNGPLGRFKIIKTEKSIYLFYDFHHTISDGGSCRRIVEAIDAAYKGEPVAVEEFTLFDIAEQEAEARATGQLATARARCAALLEGAETSFDILPDVQGGRADGTGEYARLVVDLPVSVAEYKEASRALGLPQSVVATAAMGPVVQMLNRREDVTFATIYHGRKEKSQYSTFAMMVKTLPVRVRTDGSTTVGELLNVTRSELKTMRDNDLYSFAEASAEFGVNSDFLFAFQGDFLDFCEVNGAKPDEIHVGTLSTGSKITVSMTYVGERITLDIEYRSDLFSERLMRTLATAYGTVLAQLLSVPADTRVSALALVTPGEEAGLKRTACGGVSLASPTDTVPALFRKAADAYGENTAIVYRNQALTYGELDRLTDSMAAALINRYGVDGQSVVGIMIERSELMAILPLAVMKAGAAYMPLDPHFPEERLKFMTEDAGVHIILADDHLVADAMPSYGGTVVSASQLADVDLPEAPLPEVAPGAAMVVLYTSGSTGKPKGVTLTQGNIANFIAAYRHITSLTSADIVGAYAAFGFDAHMLDLYPTLASGATVHIFDSEMRLDLTAMHDYMERERITVMFMTTQIAWQMATLFDFTHQRVMVAGGEKLPPLGPLPYTFINIYGPTECSVAATAYRLEGATDGKIIGSPLPGYEVRILDRYMRALPEGIAGELVILGPGVGCGYLNRPELNAEKFIMLQGERAYRTGDHGRCLPDGNIEFQGRIDGMVKLRGLRIELGEIEAVAAGIPEVKAFAAAVKKIGAMENLVGYFTAAQGTNPDPNHIRDVMRESLSEFMVPEILIQLDEMPLTPNGKVDRRKLPIPERQATELVPPSGPAECRLFDITADVLGHREFGATSNLLSCGLTSLMAMRLVAAIMKHTGVRITAKTVMTSPTIRELALVTGDSATAVSAGAVKTARRRFYPLTENQRGVYIDWEMNRDALQYNIPQAFRLGRNVDAELLCEAVKRVVGAHPALMTRLVWRNGDIMQERCDDNMPDITVTDLDRAPDARFLQSRVRAFDLLADRLFRCEIYRYANEIYMFIDAHHIIFDGVSSMIFGEELRRAYIGEELVPEEVSALDNALYEKERIESDEADLAEKWFDGLVGDSESTSYPRSAHPDNDIAGGMGRIKLRMDARGIREFCTKEGITVSNYLLSSFLQLLHRIIREDTIQITTINNGRSDVRLLQSIGMFVKTLPVVSRCANPAEITPAAFAAEIQKQFLTSQDYDFYPFTSLVEKKGLRPEIMYVYEGGIGVPENPAGTSLAMSPIPLALNTAKVPLTLLVFEHGDKELELVAEYDTSMYAVDDMTVLLRMMSNLSLSLPSAETLAQGVMTDRAQREQLAGMRHGMKCDVPYTSMHGALEARVDKQPDVTALIACDRTLTYAQFDSECNRIANALIKRGLNYGDRVVVLLPRKASLVTAIYGIMKAGSAYIPCDPDYPAERIRLITEDSGARFIVTTADRVALYDNAIDIEELLAETDSRRPDIEVRPDDVAYMIYTSGSTGRPKGVMIPQRAISNYLYGYYVMNYKDCPEIKVEMLLVTISFDASLNNLGVSLTCGHTLVLANEEECKDVIMLARLMLDNAVDSFDITPSRLDAMLDLPEFCEAVARCRHLNIGGESVPPALISKLYNVGFHGKAVNEYGPTETTVGSNRGELLPGKPVTAGVPFINVTQRIVDKWGAELPVGAVGELFISGRGLGLGYNNLPEKTAAAYVDYHGERAYRTGDLARWTPDGEVVILGRIDHQVKLRGLRIELGEIESVALQFEGVGKAAANVCEVNKVQHLCLYYTVSAPVDSEALRGYLADRLTEYMVPDIFMEITEMPLTPNGKTNRKALPLPTIDNASEYVAPETKLEQLIADTFTNVLGTSRTGACDDFFAIGGTSISAIKVVAALSLAGYPVTYKNVFTARTPRELACLISGKKPDAAAVVPTEISLSQSRHEKSEFADILGRNTLEAFHKGDFREVGDVLLTGATGFMGIHMLHDLLVNYDCHITCMLRRKGDISLRSRLQTLLFYYFDNSFEKEFADGRITIIEGDVTAPLAPEVVAGIKVDTIINCAANVKHFSAGNDIELVNVESVRNLIALSLDKNIRLIHISTVSIAGESVNGYPDPSLMLTEQMMDFGQSLANQYVHSKYEAERLILTAVRDKGLDAKIMRVGNLSARSSDGEFQINFRSNAFMGKLKAYATLGCAPYAALDAPCEFSPIDEVCRAILLLSTTPADMKVFQPCNNHRLPLGDIMSILSDTGHRIEFVESDAFDAAKRSAMDDAEAVNALQPLMAYDSDSSSPATFIKYDASYTNQILYRLGFRWNYTSHDYVKQFIEAIDALNFFDI